MTAVRARSALLVLALGVVSLVAVAAATSAAPPPALKSGGTLTIGLAEDPDALDPTLARTFVGRMVFMHMCEKLYDINAKLEIVPQLAAAMPKFSTNKKTLTIKLRTGIKFNDGTRSTQPPSSSRSTATRRSPAPRVPASSHRSRRSTYRGTTRSSFISRAGTRRSPRSSPTARG